MIDAHLLGEDGVVRPDHVVTGIFWKFHVQAVAGFAGPAVADAVVTRPFAFLTGLPKVVLCSFNSGRVSPLTNLKLFI